MRTFILTLTTCVFTFLLTAQSDSTKNDRQFGVVASSSVNWYYNDLYCSPLVSYRMKKHQLEIGPKFRVPKDTYYNRQIGVDLNYRYYPNGIKNRFDLFFLLNAGYLNRYLERSTVYSPGDIPANQRIKYQTYSFTVGYGINFALSKGLYLGTAISAGVGYQISRKNTTADDGSNLYSNTSKSSDPMAILDLHIGYRFKSD